MIASSLRAILDTAPDGVILTDSLGRVTMFNPASERIFGYTADEIVGGDLKRLMPSPFGDEHDQYMSNYRRTGERKIIGSRRQVMGLRKSGETFPMDLAVGEAVKDDETVFVGILRDVSERVRADQLRERLIEELAKRNAEQTHFVHAASHDLREPMRMITAFCGRLAKDYSDELDARGREYLSLTIAAAERMNRLLDDLVVHARMSDQTERGVHFDSNVVVGRVLEGLAQTIKRTHAYVTHGPLPQITAGQVRFERLMQNLIDNALKYVADDVHPHIRIEASREGKFWRFSVTDNGIGVERRYFERIFEPFKRLHARDRYDGTGLGLAISRKIVEGFGGAISVRSDVGKGSTFSFTISADNDEVTDRDA